MARCRGRFCSQEAEGGSGFSGKVWGVRQLVQKEGRERSSREACGVGGGRCMMQWEAMGSNSGEVQRAAAEGTLSATREA